MPGLIDGAEGIGKRKRLDPKYKPSKRARSESGEDDVQARVLILENQVFESKKNYNNISTLIKLILAKDEEPETSMIACIVLCRIFTRLMASGEMAKHEGSRQKDSVVSLWLRERYSEYKVALLQLLAQPLSASTILTLCMRMLKNEGNQLHGGREYQFPFTFLKDILRNLLNLDAGNELRHEFGEEYMEEYDDVRFYTFAAVKSILENENEQTESHGALAARAIDLFATIESVPETKEELDDWFIAAPSKKSHPIYSLTAHKKHAQGAWMALMKSEMNKELRKRLLGLMTNCIAPWFIKPELLMDFLSDSYDTGGSTSLLALSGVFYLIQERNLDYPSFYRKLYSLLDSALLHSKHRSRFFRLMDTFLASTHLPAVLVASFIKRLSRLTLNAPPAGIVAAVPWIYNLLKMHPTCTFLVHREVRGDEQKEVLQNEGLDDPFLADEEDPMITKAIDSSLWEIVTLQSHYHPNVATLANIISEQFTKQAYNLEDFLDHSYGSMLDTELSKEVRKPPIVEYEIPQKIFMKQEAESSIEDSLLVKLWDFS